MSTPNSQLPTPKGITLAALAAGSLLLATPARAQAPHVYAITNARIVTAAGSPIENGTIVFRDGVIEQVGAGVTPPPAARVYDGKGLTVYPGLIDMGHQMSIPLPAGTAPRTTEDAERAKRDLLLRPQLRAAAHVAIETPGMKKLVAAGVTSVLAVPSGGAVLGRSALVNTALPADEPQIGALADIRRGQPVLRTPVAVHIEVPERPPGGDAYPNSLMGMIAFIRQSLLDAQHYGAAQGRGTRMPFDPALEGLQPVVAGRLPVVYRADTVREIDRALAMTSEFKLEAILAGARQADDVVADLKARSMKVIFNLRYPERPKSLAPDADEPLRVLRDRADAPKAPAALQQADILFAFESGGLENPKDFVKNAAKAVKAGLPADAAIRALTINAATIAGIGDRLGSLERGKLANIIVTDGDLFEEKTTIKHVFVDGRPVPIEDAPAERNRRTNGAQ